MLCKGCGVNKLSNEFPDQHLSENCSHAISFCMRCAIEYIKNNKQCPVCQEVVNPTSPIMHFMQATLDSMFKDYVVPDYTIPGETGDFTIVTLTGEKLPLPYHAAMTVLELKQQIFHKWTYKIGKQRLLYNEKELPTFLEDKRSPTLNELGVKANSSIFLVIRLCAINDNLEEVVFDLHWGFPTRTEDFLDASCFIFSRHEQLGIVDYTSVAFKCSQVSYLTHSGDIVDRAAGRGHHKITLKVREIPLGVTHLFFTLSAWQAPTLSAYRNPSLRFYEVNRPDEDLCGTSFTHAADSQAIVMCYVSRDESGTWFVDEVGKLSAGNAKSYESYALMQETIEDLIRQGL